MINEKVEDIASMVSKVISATDMFDFASWTISHRDGSSVIIVEDNAGRYKITIEQILEIKRAEH